MKLGELSDQALVSRVAAFCREEQTLLAHILAGLIEIENRQLHLELASSSLYDFCVNRLGMSESLAFRRIAGARLVRDFPCLLPRVASGGIHLSGLLLLRGYLTKANAETLAADASGLPESKLKELLARRFPRPAVPERIEPLVTQGVLGKAAAPVDAPRSSTEPLSSTTYLVRLTLKAVTHGKLLRARDMLRHRDASGDLANVVDRALDVLLDRLERDRFGKADRPHAPRVGEEDISRSTRREVIARDGEQCTYRSKSGDRCPARALLEFDHGHARALGGAHGPENVRVLCAAHNHFRAEKDFGKGYIAKMVAHRRAATASRKRRSGSPSDNEGTTAAGIQRRAPSTTELGSARGQGRGNGTTAVHTSGGEGRGQRVTSSHAGGNAHDRVSAAALTSIDEGHALDSAPVTSDEGDHRGSPRAGRGQEQARDEDRAVYGLVSLGFERDAASDTVQTLLGRGDEAPSLGELLREAIGILANGKPRRRSSGSRRRRARMASAR